MVRLLRPPVRKQSGPYSDSPGAHTRLCEEGLLPSTLVDSGPEFGGYIVSVEHKPIMGSGGRVSSRVAKQKNFIRRLRAMVPLAPWIGQCLSIQAVRECNNVGLVIITRQWQDKM